MSIFITADDLGISPGVNQTIYDGHRFGMLTHTSIMVNAPFFDNALKNIVKKLPKLKVGLHINLSLWKPLSPLSEIPLLINFKNEFKYDFLGWFFAPYINCRKELERQIEKEIEAQIIYAKKNGIELTHIDSHLHVHIIPYINKITRKLAEKYGIGRVREINENFWNSISLFKSQVLLNPIGIIGYLILYILNKPNKNKKDTYFLSILLSCRMEEKSLKNIKYPSSFSHIELMLHPGNPEIDKDIIDKKFALYTKKYINKLLSKYRISEYNILLNKNLFKRFNV